MRAVLLLMLVLAFGCDSRGNRSPIVPCDVCFDYDGTWIADASQVITDNNGSYEDWAGETDVVIDQIGSGVVFSGVISQATEGGLYFLSDKQYDAWGAGHVWGFFVGSSQPDDPLRIDLLVEWQYLSWDPIVYQTVDLHFTLLERKYE